MLHHFNVNLAKDHGVNEAIFMHNIEFWTRTNLANRKHIINGLCWTYNKLEAFSELLPYYSKQQIERLINKLIKKGLLFKENHNQTAYDRTCWYAMTPLAYSYYKDTLTDQYIDLMNATYPQNLEQPPYFPISRFREMEISKSRNGNLEIETPIPDINTNIKTDSDDPPKKSSSKKPEQIPEDFEATEEHKTLSSSYGLNLSLELDSFKAWANGANKDNCIKKYLNWNLTFSNWLRNSIKWDKKSTINDNKVNIKPITNNDTTSDEYKNFRRGDVKTAEFYLSSLKGIPTLKRYQTNEIKHEKSA